MARLKKIFWGNKRTDNVGSGEPASGLLRDQVVTYLSEPTRSTQSSMRGGAEKSQVSKGVYFAIVITESRGLVKRAITPQGL